MATSVQLRDRQPVGLGARLHRFLAARQRLDNGPQCQGADAQRGIGERSEEHTSEFQSLMRSSYADFCLNQNTTRKTSRVKLQHQTLALFAKREITMY